MKDISTTIKRINREILDEMAHTKQKPTKPHNSIDLGEKNIVIPLSFSKIQDEPIKDVESSASSDDVFESAIDFEPAEERQTNNFTDEEGL